MNFAKIKNINEDNLTRIEQAKMEREKKVLKMKVEKKSYFSNLEQWSNQPLLKSGHFEKENFVKEKPIKYNNLVEIFSNSVQVWF